MDKSELRKHIRGLKAEHEAQELDRLSRLVVDAVRRSDQWQRASVVALYHPLPDEVDTRPLIDEALQRGATVLLPQVVGDDLVLRRYTGRDSLQKGAFGILEPCGPPCDNEQDVELIIVPGMAFTTDGRRLGRGRGYYDRLLPRLSGAWRMGICWPFQIVDDIPTYEHDIRMDEVVTGTLCAQ